MATNEPAFPIPGDVEESVAARVRSGRYASADEVFDAALRALEREEAALDEALRRKVRAALDDPRPSLPADEVFAELRAHHAERVKAAGRDA